MNLNSKKDLVARLKRGRTSREQFVASHLSKGIAYQIRATRDRLGWSQERLANEVGMNQNAISRLESSNYGRPTLTSLKRLAAALDVVLIVRLVPFSEMIDWVSGTPRILNGLTNNTLAVPNFEKEECEGVFDLSPSIQSQGEAVTEIKAKYQAEPSERPAENIQPPVIDSSMHFRSLAERLSASMPSQTFTRVLYDSTGGMLNSNESGSMKAALRGLQTASPSAIGTTPNSFGSYRAGQAGYPA